MGPPTGSRFKWSHIGGWGSARFNMVKENYLRFGRCTVPNQLCDAGAAVHAAWANCTAKERGTRVGTAQRGNATKTHRASAAPGHPG